MGTYRQRALPVVPPWSETSSRCGEDIARDAVAQDAWQSKSTVPRFILTPMPKPRRNTAFLPLDDTLFTVKQRKAVPHEFVLDAIAPLSPWTRPMFGCLAVYVKEKIVLVLRDKHKNTADNGVWLATTEEHHESLCREFPNMRSITVLGKAVTGWQVLPADAPDLRGSGAARLRAHRRRRSTNREGTRDAASLTVGCQEDGDTDQDAKEE